MTVGQAARLHWELAEAVRLGLTPMVVRLRARIEQQGGERPAEDRVLTHDGADAPGRSQ